MQLELIVQDALLEAPVTDNSRTMALTIAGAVIGAAAGYILFTERGRELRKRFEPALDNLASELNSFRSTIEKAAGVANEGWKLLNEAMESGSQQSRYPTLHQKSPF
jgi:gas vesicle protein